MKETLAVADNSKKNDDYPNQTDPNGGGGKPLAFGIATVFHTVERDDSKD